MAVWLYRFPHCGEGNVVRVVEELRGVVEEMRGIVVVPFVDGWRGFAVKGRRVDGRRGIVIFRRRGLGCQRGGEARSCSLEGCLRLAL